jgi:GH24 family phage-related lysozyme (muramidase)
MATPISPALMRYLNELKGPHFEKTIAYMYVDTVGAVTVGVGHNLTASKDQGRLPFVVKRFERKPVLGGNRGVAIATASRVIDRPASAAEIENDYMFLAKNTGLGKFDAEQLAAYTTLELQDRAIDALFAADLQTHVAIARREFPDFDSYPVPCQAGLVDIAFNCGGFSSFGIHFVPAVKGIKPHDAKTPAQRWRFAAQHCRRGQVSAVRNARVAQWFAEGAMQIEKAVAAQ